MVSSWMFAAGIVVALSSTAVAFAPLGLTPSSGFALRSASGIDFRGRSTAHACGPSMDLDWYKVRSPIDSALLGHVIRQLPIELRELGGCCSACVMMMREAPSLDDRVHTCMHWGREPFLVGDDVIPFVQMEKGDDVAGGGAKYTFTIDVRFPHPLDALPLLKQQRQTFDWWPSPRVHS